MKPTSSKKFYPHSVIERTINIVPHIVLSLELGYVDSPTSEKLPAAELTIKDYATRTVLNFNFTKYHEVLKAFKQALEYEIAGKDWNSIETFLFVLTNSRNGIRVVTRNNKWLIMTRFNYVVGMGIRSLVQPIQNFIEHFEYLEQVRQKWLKQTPQDTLNSIHEVTTPNLIIRSINTVTDNHKLHSTSVVAFSCTKQTGEDSIGININSPYGKLSLGDLVDSCGGRDDMYKRPVPFILDRLAEGMAFLLDQPTKFGTVVAEPLLPLFEEWQDSNAYVSHVQQGYMIMNCDQYPTYGKAGWSFNYTHLKSVYDALRDVLNNYPQH